MASNVSRFEVTAEAESRHIQRCTVCATGKSCAARTALQDQQTAQWQNLTEEERLTADPS